MLAPLVKDSDDTLSTIELPFSFKPLKSDRFVLAKYSLRSIFHYSNPEDSIEGVQMRRRQAAAIRWRKEEEAELAEIEGARKNRMPVVQPGHLL